MKVMKLFKAKSGRLATRVYPTYYLRYVNVVKWPSGAIYLRNYTGYIFSILTTHDEIPTTTIWEHWYKLHNAKFYDKWIWYNLRVPESVPDDYKLPIWPGILITEDGERILMDVHNINKYIEIL